MRATWPAGTTAGASRWMPRCASRAAIAPGSQRLLRYCARPPCALERLEQLPDGQLVYRFPRLQPDGITQLRLTPLELIERLAALIPPPRLHRHRYHGVLAPNSPQRAQVTALARGRQPRSRPHRCQRAIPRSTPSARPRACSGRCCWPASTRFSPCAVCSAGLKCASSPSSPAPQRSHPSSPTWASPPALLEPAPDSIRGGSRTWPPALGPARRAPTRGG